jgi:hypothetical protein
MYHNTYHDYNHVINELQDYMLTNELFKRTNLYSNTNATFSKVPQLEVSNVQKCKTEKPKDKYNYPKQKDTLFWCFYIMMHGDVAYEMLQPINLIAEKKIKIEYIEKIRQNKILIKQHKYATLTHIENHLLNEPKIDIKTFFSLCVLENLNVFYIHKKTYFELLMNDDMNNIFILKNFDNTSSSSSISHQKYGFEPETYETIKNYKKELFHVENLEKPVKAISAYKLGDLIDFCNKLGLEVIHPVTQKPKKKQELYEALIQYF